MIPLRDQVRILVLIFHLTPVSVFEIPEIGLDSDMIHVSASILRLKKKLPEIIRKRCEKGLLWLIALGVTGSLVFLLLGLRKAVNHGGECTGVQGAAFTVPK